MNFKNFFKIGWCFLPLMFILETVLPPWMGDENGVVENMQMLVLGYGLYFCTKLAEKFTVGWGGDLKAFSRGGCIFFFMLLMREINWGRALLLHEDGSMYKYSEMGLYGQLVHPMVGILIVTLLYLMYRSKIWVLLKESGLNISTVILMALYVAAQWLAEHGYTCFYGNLAEELAELGAYMTMLRMMLEIISSYNSKKA